MDYPAASGRGIRKFQPKMSAPQTFAASGGVFPIPERIKIWDVGENQYFFSWQ